MKVYALFIFAIVIIIFIDLLQLEFSRALNRTLRLLLAWVASLVVVFFLSSVHPFWVYIVSTLTLVFTYKLLKSNSFSNFQHRLISKIKGSN